MLRNSYQRRAEHTLNGQEGRVAALRSPTRNNFDKQTLCCEAGLSRTMISVLHRVFFSRGFPILLPMGAIPSKTKRCLFVPTHELNTTLQTTPRARQSQEIGGKLKIAAFLPATAAVDRSCCTRVSRIRANTHSRSKSSSSRISIWRVAVTDGHEGLSAV